MDGDSVTGDIVQQIAALQAQAGTLAFDRFGHEEALQLGQILLQLSQARRHPVMIGIDLGPQAVFRAALPGSTPDNQSWLERKFAAVRRFYVSSLELELQQQLEPGFAALRGLDIARYAFAGGALPLRIGPTVVGVAGVSGLRSADDHALVAEAIGLMAR